MKRNQTEKYVRMSIMYHISSSLSIRFLQSKNTFFHVVFFSGFEKYINVLMCIKNRYRECRKIKEKKKRNKISLVVQLKHGFSLRFTFKFILYFPVSGGE